MPLLRMEVSFQKNEAKLLILQVRLTFNNVFFITRNFKFYDFLTLL